MLGKSSDKLPYNIVYVLDADNGSSCEVIGHSRLCKVHGHNKSCFIESGVHVVLLFMYSVPLDNYSVYSELANIKLCCKKHQCTIVSSCH